MDKKVNLIKYMLIFAGVYIGMYFSIFIKITEIKKYIDFNYVYYSTDFLATLVAAGLVTNLYANKYKRVLSMKETHILVWAGFFIFIVFTISASSLGYILSEESFKQSYNWAVDVIKFTLFWCPLQIGMLYASFTLTKEFDKKRLSKQNS